MTHTYNISGMTCSGCVTKVKSQLLKHGDVLSANVQLDEPQATIEMSKHISVDDLQKAIGAGKYVITEAHTPMQHHNSETSTENNSYFPIFLIFGYVTGATLFLQISHSRFDWMSWMSSFMAGFFLLFSFFKLLNLKGFAEGYGTYDIVAKKIPSYGFVYPFIELLFGIAFLTNFQPLITNTVTFIIMGVSTIGVVQSLMRKSNFQCACLGTIIKLPLSKVTLFEDVLMVTMSLIMILNHYGIS